MGGFFGKVFSRLMGKKELKIIIIGLDNSGKTTILSKPQLTQTNCISTKLNRQCPVLIPSNSHRIQHGNCPVQEPTVPGVGSGWTELNQVVLHA